MYTVNLDKDGFILSVSHTAHDSIHLDLEEMDMNHLTAYQLIGEKAILNNDKLAELLAEEEQKAKDTEIASLKKSLADSDYIIAETFENVLALNNPVTFISDFIKILVQFNSKYTDLIANRKIWRDRIEELSK